MKIFTKLTTITMIFIIVIVTIGNDYIKATEINTNISPRLPVRVGLFSKDLSDDYLIDLRKDFEDIQKNNEGKVTFTFYDAKFNQETQNADIDKKLREGLDLLLIDMVEVNKVAELVNKISKYEIPVIFFNREPLTIDGIKTYKKALYVGTDSRQAGILQGKMLVDAWNSHKESIDKNKDNILQYIMLVGERFNKTSLDRSTFSISTVQEAGIKTEELASKILNWNTENAQNDVGSLFLKYGNKIEAIISNDDSMAIGAVQALQKFGYNKGDKTKVIPVVGVDGVPEAIDLISKGFMLGTAVQDHRDMANAIYTIGMNLVYGKNPVEGTPYNLDETGAAVRIPFKEYIGPMFNL
ncbi:MULTISPECIES: galactose ABC transporter substrate-binding protein [unclassified Clostridium]|uniref:galactose ABC transporter substrate-binding protein n=1 Tax=unclassified Clostridium TaxID=2614128 RepID=UPI0002978B2A|nr:MULTISPECIES: galactose ABC transporter substrate-binding protein [unclassified Clostridium]EKQ57459.1 MAG: ABC-type sugar transport system, periplasmic component [Clostridium sp. Maddingley MBC34-26]